METESNMNVKATAYIRVALAGEEKTISEYEQFAQDIQEFSPLIAAVFRDIAEEEKVHVGELRELLSKYDNTSRLDKEGAKEVEDISKEVNKELLSEKLLESLAKVEHTKANYREIINKLL